MAWSILSKPAVFGQVTPTTEPHYVEWLEVITMMSVRVALLIALGAFLRSYQIAAQDGVLYLESRAEFLGVSRSVFRHKPSLFLNAPGPFFRHPLRIRSSQLGIQRYIALSALLALPKETVAHLWVTVKLCRRFTLATLETPLDFGHTLI